MDLKNVISTYKKEFIYLLIAGILLFIPIVGYVAAGAIIVILGGIGYNSKIKQLKTSETLFAGFIGGLIVGCLIFIQQFISTYFIDNPYGINKIGDWQTPVIILASLFPVVIGIIITGIGRLVAKKE